MRHLLAGLLLFALASPALAAVQANLGVLTCTLAEVGEQSEAPPSQKRAMICTFKPNGGGPEEQYTGEVQKVGVQDGLANTMVLIWTVLGPDRSELAPGLLAQTYVGKISPTQSADQPPKMLVGEADENFSLRPMSDEVNSKADAGSVTVVVLTAKTIPS